MSMQAKRLEAWLTLWQAVKDMLEMDLEPTDESNELIDALCAMSND